MAPSQAPALPRLAAQSRPAFRTLLSKTPEATAVTSPGLDPGEKLLSTRFNLCSNSFLYVYPMLFRSQDVLLLMQQSTAVFPLQKLKNYKGHHLGFFDSSTKAPHYERHLNRREQRSPLEIFPSRKLHPTNPIRKSPNPNPKPN